VEARIEEVSYLLLKHKWDKIGEEENTHEKIASEIEEGRLHSWTRRGGNF
jgi:hypothetical protein